MLKYYYYRLLWNFAPYFKYGKIIHLDLELTNRCNQSCLSCWHSRKLKFKIVTMDTVTACRKLSDARSRGIMSVKLNFRGESTLYPGIADIIAHARRMGFIDIMLNSNLQVGLKKLRSILDAGLTTLIVSVDSFDRATYCKLHGCTAPDYYRLIDNLEYLRGLRRQNKLKCRVKLNFHINKYNQNENWDYYENEFSMFPAIKKYTMPREGQNISIGKKPKKRKRVCPHMMRRELMTAIGKIYPCCMAYNEPADIDITYHPDELRELLIENYKEKKYKKTCENCTSGDIWKNR